MAPEPLDPVPVVPAPAEVAAIVQNSRTGAVQKSMIIAVSPALLPEVTFEDVDLALVRSGFQSVKLFLSGHFIDENADGYSDDPDSAVDADDDFVGAWGTSRGVRVQIFPAETNIYGANAGLMRNRAMLGPFLRTHAVVALRKESAQPELEDFQDLLDEACRRQIPVYEHWMP